MKQSYTKILSLIVCLLCGISAIAHDFESGGIYYNITDVAAKTVEVTSGAKKYTGNVTIPSAVSYNGSDYSVTSIGEKAFYFNDWKSLGKGKINDAFFFSNYYEVEIQQDMVNPNQFRLVKPYHEALNIENYGGPGENTDEYMYFKILQPGDAELNGVSITKSDLVYFAPFCTGWNNPTYNDIVNVYHPITFTSMQDESYFTHNKVLSYQDNGLPAVVQLAPMYYMDNTGGWNKTQEDGMITIIFPGVVIKDYSVGIEYSGTYTDDLNNVYAEFNVSMGNDVKEVKVGMAITEDADEVYSKMLDGTIKSVTLTSSGVTHLALDASGKYTAVAISYDASGNIKEIADTKFNYSKTKWKSLGMATYTDDFIASLFNGVEPVTYNVEVQESEETPGLYRLVNPYGVAFPYNEAGDWDTSSDYYLEINAQDPQGVYIETQELGFDWGYGMFSASSYAYQCLANYDLETIKAAGYCGTLENGVITFPTKTLLITATGLDGFYYANQNSAFKVELPSAVATSSKSVKSTSNKSVAIDKGSIKLRENAQKMKQIKALSKTYNLNKPLDTINSCAFTTVGSKIALNSNRKSTLSNESAEVSSELTSVTIPNSVISIGNNAFEGCTGLKELIFEDGSETLSMGDNYNSTGLSTYCPLEKLYLGRNLSYNYYPFYEIKTLQEVTISNSVTSISEGAFNGCSGLTEISIPNSVTSIGDYAFYECSGLTEISIPNSVTSIGWNVFDYCSGITSIVVESGNSVYDSRNNCNAIIETATNTLIAGCKNSTIPNSVTSIGPRAFCGCTGLTSITIPNSVTLIDMNAFADCTGLTEVNIFDLSAWCKIDIDMDYANPLYYAKKLKLNGSEITDLVIPDDITEIKQATFYGYTGLTSVTIPNSVTSIGPRAFFLCTGLTEISIPNSVTSISEDAFNRCSGLTEISIPNSVTEIGSGAFYLCTGLTEISIPNSVTEIGSGAFYYTGWYNNHADGILYLDNCCLYYKGRPTGSLSLKEDTRLIADAAFYGCTGLTEISIPNSVTSIGRNAFYGCSGLTEISIPNSVTSIGEYAFFGCTGLTSVTIPNSVTSIRPCTFYGCTGLTEISIPKSVTSIGNAAFYGCTGLTEISIPNSVTSIGEYAFYRCTGLTSVKSLNTTPPTCGDNAFNKCYGAVLEVPADTKEAYSTAAEWCNFTNIIEIATVEVSTQDNNATFEIPTTQGAVTYTVNVYADEAMTQLVATTNYDATGKIIPMATSLELSIDGFEDGTYYYNVVAKSESGETLSNYTGTFEIDAAGISQVEADSNAVEIARYDINGRLLSVPTKGVNIVKYSDGTTRKECVKK